MTGEEIRTLAFKIASHLPKSELDYPFGEDVPVFKVMGKMFMLGSELHGKKLINLKVEPDHGEMLRDLYPSIQVGYHMNKRHWISVYEGEQISAALIQDLVVSKSLTKAQKQVLAVYQHIK